MSGAGDAGWRPRANPWLIAFMVTLATFMEVLDTTIVNVCLPHIAGSMSASNDDAAWTLTSYLVANGIVVPISGWLGRLLGRKRYFLICIAMFTVCSFLCGIATSLPQLVLFRLLQGFFGGGMQPMQQSIVLDTFEPSQRGRAFSVVAIAIIFAPVIGPTLGGWITDHYTWRWIFLINVPVGVVAFLAVARLVEDPPWVLRDRARLGDVDAVGLGLIALGLGSLQFVLDRGEDYDWFGSPAIRIFAVVAAVGMIGAVAWLLLVDKPVVNLRVLADRNFAVGSVMIFGIGAVLYSTNVLIPLLAEAQFGYTAQLTGELMVPGALLMFALIPLVGRVLMPLVQTRYVIAFGFAALGASLIYAHGLSAQMSYGKLVLMRAALTLGLAFLFVPNGTISYSTLPRSLTPDATALYAMFRNVAGSAGIALVTALVTQHTQMHRAYLAQHLTPFDPPYLELLWQNLHRMQESGMPAGAAHDAALGLINRTLDQQAAILAYTDVFAIMAIAAFAIVPLTFLFRPGRIGGGAARRWTLSVPSVADAALRQLAPPGLAGSSSPSAMLAGRRAGVGDAPQRAVAVLGEQQRAVMRRRHANRTAPHAVGIGDEAGDEILVAAVRHAVAQVDPYDFIAGAVAAVPGSVQRHEGVALVVARKCRDAGAGVEGHAERRRVRLDQHIRDGDVANEVGAFALVPRVLVVADIVPRPAVEFSLLHPGDVVGGKIVAEAVALVGGTPQGVRRRDRQADAVAQAGGEYLRVVTVRVET